MGISRTADSHIQNAIGMIKKALYRFTTMRFRARVRFSTIDFVKTPPIFVFQMGKVASTSICNSLSSMDLGRPVYQAHYLSEEGIKKARHWHKMHQGKIPCGIDYYELLGKKIRRSLGKANYTIITGVRDPIAKEISNYFELAQDIDHGLRNEDGELDTSQIIGYLLNRFRRFSAEGDSFFTSAWFDQELKGTFGIDIYEYPFDCGKGYSIFRRDGLDLLVYQYERLNQIYRPAVSELLGIKPDDVPALRKDNMGKKKWYSDIYAEVKEGILIPLEVCQSLYGIRYVEHFYSRDQIFKWVKQWTELGEP